MPAAVFRLKAEATRERSTGIESRPTQPTPDILLSRQLAEQEHIHAGDVVTLALDAHGDRATRFRVAGIYEHTPDPKKFPAKRLEARMHLPDLIALTADQDDPLSVASVSAINLDLAAHSAADREP